MTANCICLKISTNTQYLGATKKFLGIIIFFIFIQSKGYVM